MMKHFPMVIIQHRSCVQTTFSESSDVEMFGSGTSINETSDIIEDHFRIALNSPPDVNGTITADFTFFAINDAITRGNL